ncbi:DUF2624 domain-containing protein [Oceanobacillus damuensis]|uniref:DUF2624 domain-containing protein n=1 Tax=Oceanobacillus damuensis TaxID=937928 RepID=UPI00082D50EB|nr:DUF2624 domain-containing protein [Oceanobacillus damuensis]
MSIFIKEMVKAKLKNLTAGELLQYSRQYGFDITEKQAREITAYLHQNSPDPFDADTRKRMFQQLALITDRETAIQTQELFDEIIHSYGLDHLFK